MNGVNIKSDDLIYRMPISISDKARKIIKDGRIKLNTLEFRIIRATVQGEHGVYKVEVFRDGRFNCECENFLHTDSTVECSHVLALKMHPKYREWFPYVLIQNEVVEKTLLKATMPKFNLNPLNLRKIRPIDEKLVRLIENSPELDDLTKFMLRKRWVEKMSYKQIKDAVYEELDTDVSEWFVKKTVKPDPREYLEME